MGRVWNRELVVNYCKMLEEMHLPRRTWLTVNRIRKLQDRYGGHLLHKWKYRNYPSCDCGETEPAMDHIVTECPKRLFFIKASLVFIIRYSGSYRMDRSIIIIVFQLFTMKYKDLEETFTLSSPKVKTVTDFYINIYYTYTTWMHIMYAMFYLALYIYLKNW